MSGKIPEKFFLFEITGKEAENESPRFTDDFGEKIRILQN